MLGNLRRRECRILNLRSPRECFCGRRSCLCRAGRWLRIDQHSRIEQALRVHGRLGRPEGSREQFWALAIVPPPMVPPDRMMMRDGSPVRNDSIETGRLNGVPLSDQLAMPSGGLEGEIRRRPVRIDMGAAAGHLAGTPSCLDDGTLGRGFDLVVK